jgi:hypothetical protein
VNIYERYGKKQEMFEDLLEAYQSTLELLQNLIMGAVTVDQIILSPDGWQLKETTKSAEMSYEERKKYVQEFGVE